MHSDRWAASHVAAFVIALIPLGACTSSQRGASASLDKEAPPRGVLLTVDNRNTADARVYLVRPGLRLRLGMLEAHARRTFSLPASYLGFDGFELQTELIASRERHHSRRVAAVPGDRVELTIGHRLTLSRVVVHR